MATDVCRTIYGAEYCESQSSENQKLGFVALGVLALVALALLGSNVDLSGLAVPVDLYDPTFFIP